MRRLISKSLIATSIVVLSSTIYLAFGAPSSRQTAASAASELDMTKYHETFSETFRGKLDVTPLGPSKWIAHTPWQGDFGDAAFANPSADFPFHTGPDGLTITARKAADGKWQSGLLSSVDAQDRGFLQSGGYFEARMKMPPGPGTWPAFWLVSHSDPKYHVEIDVVEYYGHGTNWYQTNLILWPKDKSPPEPGKQVTIWVERDSLWRAFHTYGVEIRDDNIIYYLDRHVVRRVPTPPAAKAPLSILINLALGSGWPIDKTPNPSVLQVDYVKAYRHN